MFGFGLLGKTHIPHRKNTEGMPAARRVEPKEVLLVASQHIGAPATPIVKAGDTVKVGQKIAEAGGYVSSPIYASVSGVVGKPEEYLRSDGRKVAAIRIASDGLMTPAEVTPPVVEDADSLIAAVRESGVVGLGGAGFPTAVKLDAVKKNIIDTVVINGAECEPYITGDTRTMLDNADLVKEGVDLFRRHFAPFGVKSYVFGIENNKREAIDRLTELFAPYSDVSVVTLPSTYPQGAEKILIHNTVKRVVPEGKLPADVGVVVINVTTLAEIARYVKTGMPLVSRTVTVDGSAIASPANLTVPIGTPLRDLVEAVGGAEDIGKVLFGGPMMGLPASNLDEPTTKTTGAVTVLTRRDSIKRDSTACIHCGRCVAACPMRLNPTAFSKALNIESKEEKVARLQEYKIGLCMECGCCSYVCPAARPLVQNNRLAKAEVREYNSHIASVKK